MGNITLIQTVRKDEQVPESRDRKVSTLSCLEFTAFLLHPRLEWEVL